MTHNNMTQERAATRFHHIAILERQLARTCAEIADCKDHLKELKKRESALIDRIRCAARDEGELPLFDADEES
jgi:hypothetical protein